MATIRPLATYLFFFFNDTATTEIYTLSLHDALPICTHHDDQHTPVAPLACAHGVRVVLVAEQVDAHDTGEARDGGQRAEARALEAAGAQRVERNAGGERGDGANDRNVPGAAAEKTAPGGR